MRTVTRDKKRDDVRARPPRLTPPSRCILRFATGRGEGKEMLSLVGEGRSESERLTKSGDGGHGGESEGKDKGVTSGAEVERSAPAERRS